MNTRSPHFLSRLLSKINSSFLQMTFFFFHYICTKFCFHFRRILHGIFLHNKSFHCYKSTSHFRYLRMRKVLKFLSDTKRIDLIYRFVNLNFKSLSFILNHQPFIYIKMNLPFQIENEYYLIYSSLFNMSHLYYFIILLFFFLLFILLHLNFIFIFHESKLDFSFFKLLFHPRLNFI